MHMLRQLLGDTAFFQAWREYGQEHAYGSTVTSDWQQKCEQHYGSSLQWFFDEWVYTGTRYPQYQVTLDFGDIAVLSIAQVQTTGTLFRMPIDVRIYSGGDSANFTVWNNAVESQAWGMSDSTFMVWPDSVHIDPDNKILKAVTYRTLAADPREPAAPASFEISSVSPNPFNSSAVLRFELPKFAPVRVRIFDILGREVAVRSLGTLAAGEHQFRWDGSNAASGVYLFRLETDHDYRIAKAVLLK
jgi:hypothetical protein